MFVNVGLVRFEELPCPAILISVKVDIEPVAGTETSVNLNVLIYLLDFILGYDLALDDRQ